MIASMVLALATLAPRSPSPKAASAVVSTEILSPAEGTQRIAQALIARDLASLVQLCPAPFSFDGHPARTALEVRQRWAEILDRHPVDRLRLYGIDLLPYPAMVGKYGPPPARLAELPLHGASIAVANLGGRATLVLWKRHGQGYQAFGVSD